MNNETGGYQAEADNQGHRITSLKDPNSSLGLREKKPLCNEKGSSKSFCIFN